MKITITATGSESLGIMGNATADHDHPPEALQRAVRAMQALVPSTDPGIEWNELDASEPEEGTTDGSFLAFAALQNQLEEVSKAGDELAEYLCDARDKMVSGARDYYQERLEAERKHRSSGGVNRLDLWEAKYRHEGARAMLVRFIEATDHKVDAFDKADRYIMGKAD